MCHTRKQPTILLVDDEVRILSALQRTLRREGYDLLAIDSPTQALAILEAQSVDLIVSDHKMPTMSGLQFLARVAQERPQIVRILLTGWTEAVPPEDLTAAGIRAILPKPWDDAELKALLRESLCR